MKQEQQQQAQNLYFQTDLSKAEIASMLGISRRTIHYWAHDNNWDQIKKDPRSSRCSVGHLEAIIVSVSDGVHGTVADGSDWQV